VEGEVLERKVGAGTEAGTQRSKEAREQGDHLVIVHHGGLYQSGAAVHQRHRRKTAGADDYLANHSHCQRKPSHATKHFAFLFFGR
jgi:hypothetical protein